MSFWKWQSWEEMGGRGGEAREEIRTYLHWVIKVLLRNSDITA